MTLMDLERWISTLLDIPSYAAVDASRNGLQVARRSPQVERVAFAVDASMEAFRRAAEAHADALIVHHGILWDTPLRVTGAFYERIRFLVEADIALFGVHLPLDAHPEVGNNVGIARLLGLVDIRPFGTYKGATVGCKGSLPVPTRIEEVAARLAARQGEPIRTLPFGPPEVRTVGIVSGAAPWAAEQASAQGLDLFITGEPAHSLYHHCLEARLHAIFDGHYHSESYGVHSLAERLSRETGLATTYIDVPTGM